jgi:LemA protein
MVVIVLVVIVVLIAVMLMVMYNKLVRLRNRIENAWSQIDVQLQRRNDLIPNLVETVKGYAAHEKGVLEGVTQARAGVMNAQGPAETAAADNVLTGALKSLFAVSEAYPDLKANQNFLSLQEELSATEDKVAYSRQFYNDAVRGYNTSIQSFPTNLIANNFGFKAREYYEAGDDARGAVRVQF